MMIWVLDGMIMMKLYIFMEISKVMWKKLNMEMSVWLCYNSKKAMMPWIFGVEYLFGNNDEIDCDDDATHNTKGVMMIFVIEVEYLLGNNYEIEKEKESLMMMRWQ